MKKSSKKSKKHVKQLSLSPQSRAGHIFAGDDDITFLAGGYSESGPLIDVWILSSAGWSSIHFNQKAKSPFPRMMTDGCVIDSKLYVVAGVTQDNDDVLILNDIWKLQKLDGGEYSWICIYEECIMPERHNHVALSLPGGRLFVHGGECGRFLGDSWIYDTVNNNFLQIPTHLDASPCPRSSHSATFCDPFVVLFGGVTSSSALNLDPAGGVDSQPVYLNDLWVLDISGADYVWRMINLNGIAPSPRDLPSVMSVQEVTGVSGDVLIFGGYGLYLEESDDDNGEEEEEDDGGEVSGDHAIANVGCDGIAAEQVESFVSKAEEVDPAFIDTLKSINLEGVSDEGNGSGDRCTEEKVGESVDRGGSGSDEGDGGSEVAEGYLSDSWIINIHNFTSTEVNLACGSSTLGEQSGWRGARFIMTRPTTSRHDACNESGFTMTGGFNGERFGGIVERLHIVRQLP